MTPFAPLARRRPRALREGRGRLGPGGLIRGCLIFTLRALCIKAFASGRRGASTGAFTGDTSSADRARGRGPAPPGPADRLDGGGPGLARRISGRDSGRSAAAGAVLGPRQGAPSRWDRRVGEQHPCRPRSSRARHRSARCAAVGALGRTCLPAVSFGGIDLQPRLPFVNVCPAGGGGAGPGEPRSSALGRARSAPVLAEPPPPQHGSAPACLFVCARLFVCLFVLITRRVAGRHSGAVPRSHPRCRLNRTASKQGSSRPWVLPRPPRGSHSRAVGAMPAPTRRGHRAARSPRSSPLGSRGLCAIY